MSEISEIIEQIQISHRKRRFAMKVQQKLDRALESFVRRNATDWHPSMPEKEREKENRKALALIAAVREGDFSNPMAELISGEIEMTDRAREFADEQRRWHEKTMEKLAKSLPVYSWWDQFRGLGDLGLATIVAEAGALDRYPSKGHLWKRLGLAPYEGFAGSTWKRKTWRPRALTEDEWVKNPFSGERYALIHQIAMWLRNAQCESKEKSGTDYGRPTGPYGEAYVHRREHTKVTHPDWSPGHAHMDALRYVAKRLLRDLWTEWRRANNLMPGTATPSMPAAE